MRKRYIFFLLLISSCSLSPSEKSITKFFALKEYFSDQAKLLQSQNYLLNKVIVKDKKEEKKSFTKADWLKELNPFILCDINKPAWNKSYRADTLIHSGQTVLLYTALEPNLTVRMIEIVLNNKDVVSVNISLNKKNAYYRSQQQLHYEPLKKYSITGSQKVILADSTNFYIHANFSK